MSDLIRKSDADAAIVACKGNGATRQACRDAIAALPAVTPKVKPLMWRNVAPAPITYAADTMFGLCMVLGYGNEWCIRTEASGDFLRGAEGEPLCYTTPDAAKAAAQADYEARIIAAIEPVVAPDLSDPVVVHANMLRGTIAKPTVEQIIHLYGVDALTKALAPVIVREAGIEPVAAPDPAAIREAALREAWEICEFYGATGEAIADEILALIQKGTADDRT